MDRVVVITGSNSGIGRALKQKFEKAGDIVIGVNIDGAFDDKKEFFADVSNEQVVKEVFEKIGVLYSKIDILINCAGYAVFGAVELIPSASAKNMFDVNYFGTMYCINSALKYMQKGAKIFNISSACAFYCVPFRTHYSASKAAVSMLSYGLRMELKDSGIDVVAICPGDVKTNFSKNRKKTLETNFRYGDRILKNAEKIDKRENKRMSVEYATNKMFKIMNKKKTKPMYIVGKNIKFLHFASRFISTKTLLHFTNKMF